MLPICLNHLAQLGHPLPPAHGAGRVPEGAGRAPGEADGVPRGLTVFLGGLAGFLGELAGWVYSFQVDVKRIGVPEGLVQKSWRLKVLKPKGCCEGSRDLVPQILGTSQLLWHLFDLLV